MNTAKRRHIRNKLYEKDETCVWCKRHLHRNEATIEHMIPKSKGGTNKQANLKLACRHCNTNRGNLIYGMRAFHNFVARERIIKNM